MPCWNCSVLQGWQTGRWWRDFQWSPAPYILPSVCSWSLNTKADFDYSKHKWKKAKMLKTIKRKPQKAGCYPSWGERGWEEPGVVHIEQHQPGHAGSASCIHYIALIFSVLFPCSSLFLPHNITFISLFHFFSLLFIFFLSLLSLLSSIRAWALPLSQNKSLSHS